MLTIGAYQAVGAAISVPLILSKPLSIGAWYAFFEAMTPLVAAWILYETLHRRSRESAVPVAREGTVRAAQVLFGLACVFYGWSHFVYADYTAGMVPAWLPAHLGLAYFTGLGHLAAGLAIIVGILPRLAATLEAIMMSLFGLLVWLPSFFAQPRPKWAMPAEHQWSEFVVTLVLAASAWVIAGSFGDRSWTLICGDD
ncbi:MAG: DoxX family membrane protein [Steroidobacteraceae bacterium]